MPFASPFAGLLRRTVCRFSLAPALLAALPAIAAAQPPAAPAPLPVPELPWVAPFVVLLLCIALLPLLPRTAHWWEHNRNKLLVAALLGLITLAYYGTRDFGFRHEDHVTRPGTDTAIAILRHTLLQEYFPFMVLLFSLYTISGGINVSGDVSATPRTNTAILALGAGLASLIGTTGASMLLIRPLLEINRDRRHVRHTVIFFIFLVSNIGGSLLPLGDPPLFLGYLRGVPFLWTLQLWAPWLFCVAVLLGLYLVWDRFAHATEPKSARLAEAADYKPLKLRGGLNFLWLLGVVVAVAFLLPGKPLAGTSFVVPPLMREGVLLALTGLAWVTTAAEVRAANRFGFGAIAEVAALFLGIFVTMQVPVEILQARGHTLGLVEPWHYFWASGVLSSFLDNAPTYVVFFETAGSPPLPEALPVLHGVETATGAIPLPLLVAISLGSVFMGANTYIGNGPNFMVRTIAEQGGVKMPSFFGYMAYSVAILIPLFVAVTFLFLR